MTARGTLLLAGGCVVLGAVVAAELRGSPDDDAATVAAPARRDEAAAAAPKSGKPAGELLATILARPLFSPTRRPPRADEAAAPAAQLGGARLTGIVTGPGQRLAIFVEEGAKPRELAEGDSVNGWRIEAITPYEVSLAGPGGRETLQPKPEAEGAGPTAVAPSGNPQPVQFHGPGRGMQKP